MAKNLKNLQKFLSPVLTHATYLEINRGRASWLFSFDGKKYLDFTAGLGVTSTGHCHPAVVKAIQNQAGKLIHGCAGIVFYEPNLKLAEQLAKIAPDGISSFFFTQSGTEAVEGALKLARFVTKKPGIIAFTGGFHGRTLGALSVTTSKEKFRRGYEPLLQKIYFFPYPYCFKCPFEKPKYPACKKNGQIGCAQDLQKFFAGLKNKKIASAIIEPILGEGGYSPAPVEFLKLLRKLCSQNKILLIFDEIQSGLGRTGKWWAADFAGVAPDILVVAKGIASGMPLGAIGASSGLMKKWRPGAHGGTYSGNPVCSAAGLATISVIKKEKLLANAAKIGNYLIQKIKKLSKSYPFIGDVRGQGLMIGLEFVKYKNLSGSEIVKKIKKFCLEKNLILITCGADDSVIRLVPALNVKKKEAELALKIIEAAFRKIK